MIFRLVQSPPNNSSSSHKLLFIRWHNEGKCCLPALYSGQLPASATMCTLLREVCCKAAGWMAFKKPQLYSFREKLVHILFYMEKALRGFFWNAMLQPQELFGTTRSTCVVQAPLHTGVLSFPTRQYKETFEYSWSRWSHLFFFFFHLFLIHAGTRLTPCPLAAPLLSSWIQNSHMLGVPRQTTIPYCHKAIKCLKIPFIFI